MMGCPLCGSANIHKDYPPARGYVLALVGLGMLCLRTFFSPEVLSSVLAGEDQRLFWIGGAVFLYGCFHLFRHGNRYCGECGFRFRATVANRGDAVVMQDIRSSYAGEGCAGRLAQCAGGDWSEGARTDESAEPRKPVAIRFEPVLACLKFKAPNQRAEAAKTLAEATGQDFGEDYDAWKKWLIENKKIRG